nr:hypothetical protein [Halomonas elongata]
MSKLDPGAGEPAHYSQVWAFRTPAPGWRCGSGGWPWSPCSCGAGN